MFVVSLDVHNRGGALFAWTLPVSALEIPHPREMPQNQANQRVRQPRIATTFFLSLDETPER